MHDEIAESSKQLHTNALRALTSAGAVCPDGDLLDLVTDVFEAVTEVAEQFAKNPKQISTVELGSRLAMVKEALIGLEEIA